jgi:NAD(P)-dependent dehydrogenase (short-subunit alcohol dehydrogenase family)
MVIDLAGETALVTGGATAIGFGIPAALAKAGARIAVNDVDAGMAE